MSTRLFAFLLAGALMVPQTVVSADAGLHGFRLPPIPNAETIPWLTSGAQRKAPSYLGLLLMPKPLADTPTVFAAVPVPNRTMLSAQLSGATGLSTE
jgi:hypothetical protein